MKLLARLASWKMFDDGVMNCFHRGRHALPHAIRPFILHGRDVSGYQPETRLAVFSFRLSPVIIVGMDPRDCYVGDVDGVRCKRRVSMPKHSIEYGFVMNWFVRPSARCVAPRVV